MLVEQAAESFRRALQQAQLEPEQLYLQRMLDSWFWIGMIRTLPR